jgi:ABC-type transporter Mla subunit MlaD
MENAMPPDDRSEQFGDFDAQIASLRAAAKSLRDERPSWFEHIFHPDRQSRRQADFNEAVVAALKDMGATIRKLTANFSERERQLSSLETEQQRFARESADSAQSTAETRQQLEQLAREQGAKIEQLVRGQGDLGNELRERIQQVLDEQRVAIRQVSLKASEDAILSDRARRASELKLEELAKRVPPRPA